MGDGGSDQAGAARQAFALRPETQSFLDREHRLLIGGRWVAGEGRRIEVENPATETVIATLNAASEAQLDAAVVAARPPWTANGAP